MSDRYVVEPCPDHAPPFQWLVRDIRNRKIVGFADSRETAASCAEGLNCNELRNRKPAPPKVAE